ncbi:MAG: hypothetical protein HY814_11245 [Candidatus Riflebacteria bacterium]|nr:hypothetical protein [Candidatus Riflebacteria bacterium]
MKTINSILWVLLAAIVAALPVAAQQPGTADLIFTGDAVPGQAVAKPVSFDCDKIDYLLHSERQDRSFDDLHAHAIAAFTAEANAGHESAIAAVADLTRLKAVADKAYEAFLADAAKLKEATGVDLLTAGTAGLARAIAGLEATKGAAASQQLEAAGKSAARVLAMRAAYRQRANAHAKTVLASR